MSSFLPSTSTHSSLVRLAPRHPPDPSFLPRPRTLPWCVLLLASLLSSSSFLPRPHTFTLCVLLLVTLLAPSSFLPRPHTFILCVLLLSSHRPLMPFKICEDRAITLKGEAWEPGGEATSFQAETAPVRPWVISSWATPRETPQATPHATPRATPRAYTAGDSA